MSSILIKNGTIITQDPARRIIKKGTVYVEGSVIQSVGEGKMEADYVIDASRCFVLPGLINTHTHLAMTLLRGYAEDLPFHQWLQEKIWPAESRMKEEHVHAGALLGMLELIGSGTTAFQDMYFWEDAVGKATVKAGLRGLLGFTIVDKGTPELKQPLQEASHFVERWPHHELVQPVIAPHAPYSCSPETLIKTKEIADRYNVRMHTHVSETRKEVYDIQRQHGVRPVELLDQLGLLFPGMALAHAVWLTKREIGIIAQKETKVSHNPVSNAKLACGIAPVQQMIESGVVVGLGTDGPASNNSLNLWETVKYATLLQKVSLWDPLALPAQRVLDMATIDGARVLGMGEKVGSIEKGKLADIIVVEQGYDLSQRDPAASLIYSGPRKVKATIVHGKPLMIDDQFMTLSPEKVLGGAEQAAAQLGTL